MVRADQETGSWQETSRSARRTSATDSASFGFREVGLDEKQGLVDRVFDRVAPRYDLMNDLMSGGLHRLWKDAMVSRLAPPRKPRRPYAVLDVAGGTGDIAFRIAEPVRRRARHRRRHQWRDARRRPRARAAARRLGRARDLRRGECRGAALRGRPLRCRDDRLRHPQRAADRAGARRGLPRAEARRTFPLPRILGGRRRRARPALRPLFLQRHPARSAGSSPATPSPTATWSNRSAASRTRRASPR